MEDSNDFFKSMGLENYIPHGKNFCDPLPRVDMDNLDYDSLTEPKVKVEQDDKVKENENSNVCEKQALICEKVVSKTDNVQADDFFSSLELQSSSKTSTTVVNVSFNTKSSSGIFTRSRSFSATTHENTSKKILSKSSFKKSVPKTKRRKLKKESRTSRKGRAKEKSKRLGNKKHSPLLKVDGQSEGKKQNGNKSDDNILEKTIGLEKQGKEDDDWGLFNNLSSKKDLDDKIFDSKQSLGTDARRCTPEFFSINSILMSDGMSEGKDEVDKLLDVDDYDDSFLEDIDEFNYAPPRSHTGGKWKPGSLTIRTSPMIWQNQTWDSLLYDRNQEEDGKSRTEIPIDSPIEFTSEKVNKYSSVNSSGGKWKSFTPPATYTGGKWKPLTPPATYTGGKWKPSETPQRIKKSEHELLSPDESDRSWKGDIPPSSHTGGKWKPSSSLNAPLKSKLEDTSPKVPPSTHTRGKWVSESAEKSVNRSTLDVLANCQSTSGKFLKTAGGMIQYYCSPCNRRLASKKMFKRHVQTELHFKRVLQENELDFDSRSLKLFHGLFTQAGYKERGLGKRIIKKPEAFKDADEAFVKKERKSVNTIKTRKKLARRDIRCEVCKIRVPSHQLGKHLVSYYHSRRIQLNDSQQQKLILENIHSIVKQAPYQCGICKFYCNTHNLFKKHWALNIHETLEKQPNKRFWCALCNFECSASRSMELHLDSNSHREVILAVNKSIPIIIRHKTIMNCNICSLECRFRRELYTHRHLCHGIKHEQTTSSKNVCSICFLKFKNLKSLQRHILLNHTGQVKIPYFCSTCNEFFTSASEAKIHRNSNSHKCKKSLAEGKDKGELTKRCSYCLETLEDLESLKVHLFQKHPTFLPKCIRCGMIFALSQEVSRHVKNNECRFTSKTTPGTSESFKCKSCPYTTTSKSEFLLHQAIHQKKDDNEKKVACPLCKVLFTQPALIIHLRSHLKEKTYQCSLCSKSFVKKDACAAHVRKKHFFKKLSEPLKGLDSLVLKDVGTSVQAKKSEEEKEIEKKQEESEKPFGEKHLVEILEPKKTHKTITKKQLCGDPNCKYVAKDMADLESHSLLHIGPKLYQCSECSYTAKTNTAIKRHFLIHTDQRSYSCPHCDFKGKLESHLTRHLKLHTGAKPFKCPHCLYSCNILENLRKHVLNTKIHPGKKLYECKQCNFETNTSKVFKMHLVDIHNCDSKTTDPNVVGGIYKKQEDSDVVVSSIPERTKSTKKASIPVSQKKINTITEKLKPIAPKPDTTKKGVEVCLNTKNTGNNVEDKRKILEMELQKIKKQIVPVVRKPSKSYPSPAESRLKSLKSELDSCKKTSSGVEKKESVDDANVLLVNVPSNDGKSSEESFLKVQQVQLSPAYVLPSEERELYFLMEEYQV